MSSSSNEQQHNKNNIIPGASSDAPPHPSLPLHSIPPHALHLKWHGVCRCRRPHCVDTTTKRPQRRLHDFICHAISSYLGRTTSSVHVRLLSCKDVLLLFGGTLHLMMLWVTGNRSAMCANSSILIGIICANGTVLITPAELLGFFSELQLHRAAQTAN